MKGMNIVLSGGSGGLGAAVAEMAAERGAAGVGIIDLNTTGALKVLKKCSDFGAETAVAVADICTSEAAHGAFDELAASLGRIDTLVNLAAIYPRKSLLDISDEEWDAENALNIKGTYHLMVAAVKHMKQYVDPAQHCRTHRQHLVGGRLQGPSAERPLCGHQGGRGEPHQIVRP